MREFLSFWFTGGWFERILMGIIISLMCLVVFGIPYLIFFDKTKENFAKLCSSKGWSNASYIEGSGKFTTTIKFCFDKDGTMKWPYEVK